MCSYLHGPRMGGMYYFRMAIPVHLRPVLGKREFFFSLKTKDRTEAKRRVLQVEAPRHIAILEAAEAALASEGGATTSAPNPAIVDALHLMSQADFDDWQRHMAKERWKLSEKEDRLLQAENWSASLSADHPATLIIREERERGDRYKRRYQRRKAESEASRPAGEAQGHETSSSPAARPGSRISPQRGLEGNSGGVTITGLFDAYAAQPDGPKAGTVEQWRPIIRHLSAFLGHDDARQVTTDDLLRWRLHIRDEAGPRGKPRSAKTINGSWLAAASVTFRYGFAERLLPSDPSAEVPNVRPGRKVKLRDKSFTRDEQKAILSATLLPQPKRVSAERALSRRWVPWICAYSGARVNEITQLRKEDFEEREGVWCMRITPEAGTQKTDEARLVPIHEHLIDQGLKKVVEDAREGPLFYAPKNNRGGRRSLAQVAGLRLADWVRNLGVDDPNIMPNHAWRHTFKTIAISAGIDERAYDAIEGHASSEARRAYGHHELPALAAQLAKFPRYEWD